MKITDKIDMYFKRKAEISLTKRPWKKCKKDDDYNHLLLQVSTLPETKFFGWIMFIVVYSIFCVVITLNILSGQVFLALFGISLSSVTLLGFYYISIMYWRSLISHKYMLLDNVFKRRKMNESI
jgi:hypothetical protein